MATKGTFNITTRSGKPFEVESHTSKKLKKLIVTKYPGQRRTITHMASGWALTSLLPLTMRTIPELIDFAESLEALDHPAWKIMDKATLAKGIDRSKMSGRDVDHLRDFQSKACAIGIDIAVKYHGARAS